MVHVNHIEKGNNTLVYIKMRSDHLSRIKKDIQKSIVYNIAPRF